jgi:hypothetical protein
VKSSERLARFASEFGVPFLSGGTATIANALGHAGHQLIRPGLSVHPPLVAVCRRHFAQAALFTDVVPAAFDEEAGTLLYAIHDLMAASHPQSAAFYARAHTFCDAALEALVALPAPLDPHRLVTRHLMVRRFFETVRADVNVKWWAGRASFLGEAPPERLMRWSTLRRVQVENERTPMWMVAIQEGDEHTRAARRRLITGLLDASPLTRLMGLGQTPQRTLGFSLRGGMGIPRQLGPLFILEHPALARAITDTLLATGADTAGSILALALIESAKKGEVPRAQRRASELSLHLARTMCWIEGVNPGTPEAGPLRRLFDEDTELMPVSTLLYWSVVRAVVDLDGDIFDLPAMQEMPEHAAALWRGMVDKLHHRRFFATSETLKTHLQRNLAGLAAA